MDVDRCRDIRPHFVAVALGTVEAGPANRVRLHLSEGCPACAAELETVLEAYYGLPLAFPPVPVPEGAAEALRAAAEETAQLEAEPAIVYAETNERRLLWTLLFLMIGAVVAAAWWGQRQVEDAEWAAQGRRAAEAQARSMAADYRMVRERLVPAEALASLVADPTSVVVDLFDNAGVARGRAVLDWPRERALLVPPAQPAPPDTTFVLWLRSGEALVRVGPLAVDPDVGPSPQPFALPELPGPGVVLELYASPNADVDAESPAGDVLVSGRGPSPEPGIE